jgi:predicted aconitase
MRLTTEEQAMLEGHQGRATQKAMEILVTLGSIYGAEQMTPVTSVQIAGVSYDNLGEAGLQFLAEMAAGGGRARVLTTLNPAGMDIENWQALGISASFADSQQRVIQSFAQMGVTTTCTCTPYLSGNVPHFGEHIAWAESSAVCYANAAIGARTNREGGPSALAAALTGRTPNYGLHLEANRRPGVTVDVQASLGDNDTFGALGKAIGARLEGLHQSQSGEKPIAYIVGVGQASVENLKSFCASLATYGGAAMFHMPGVTPEASAHPAPETCVQITQTDLERAHDEMNDGNSEDADFVSLGCPHLSVREIARIAELLRGKRVTREFWITTARPTKQIADMMGYTAIIEASGAKFAADTCCVVAPIKGRFQTLVTDSAKACYYAYAKNKFKTVLKPFDEVVAEATRSRETQLQTNSAQPTQA